MKPRYPALIKTIITAVFFVVILILGAMQATPSFAKEPTKNSIYQLSSTWKNQEGEDVNLINFQGKVVLFSIIYTQCQYACPIIISKIQRILNQLPASTQDNVRVILVSIDPENDSPQHLKQFFKEKGLTRSWNLLCGNEDEIRELTAVTGLRYQKTDAGGYNHSMTLLVLDRQGEIYFREKEDSSSVEALVQAIKKAISSKERR